MNCPELGVGNGPWVAGASTWIGADGEDVSGGVDLVQVVDGMANRHYVHYSDAAASATAPEA